jgi:DNA-binding MarR family transcriptional regulator
MRRHTGDGPITLAQPALRFLQVVWSLEHALERASKRMEDAIGVSGPQRFALRLIGGYPGLGAGQLAAVLHLHPSTVTGMVQRLESRGLVRREQHAHDGRRMHLYLTPAGRRVNRPGTQGTVEHAVRRTLAHCDAAQRRTTAAVLDRFRDELMKL